MQGRQATRWRRAIFAAALVAASFSAAASNWIKVRETASEINFVDTESIRMVNGERRIWTITKFKAEGDKSMRTLMAFSCAGASGHYLQVDMFERGEPTHSGLPEKFRGHRYVAPDSAEEAAFRAACNR